MREALDKAQNAGARAAEELGGSEAQRSAEREELSQAQRQIEGLESETAELRKSLEKAQTAGAYSAQELVRSAEIGSEEREELAKLRNDRDSLAKKLAAAESRLSATLGAGEGATEKNDDLSRQLEMATEELRETKRANLDLEVKLTKSRGTSAPSALGLAGGLDWEAQKQRLLASLEADDPGDEEAIAEHNTIEGTIRITDQIVAAKDLEIAELQQLLAQDPQTLRSAAAKADGVAEILDSDQLIRQEREKLQALQVEWRDKIGKAETELSVERAKIARERAEVADKMQIYGQAQEPRQQSGEQSDATKPVRGRWLSMLGLKDVEEKQ